MKKLNASFSLVHDLRVVSKIVLDLTYKALFYIPYTWTKYKHRSTYQDGSKLMFFLGPLKNGSQDLIFLYLLTRPILLKDSLWLRQKLEKQNVFPTEMAIWVSDHFARPWRAGNHRVTMNGGAWVRIRLGLHWWRRMHSGNFQMDFVAHFIAVFPHFMP